MTATLIAVCDHTPAACCWMCSDQDPRWREWRLRAGYSEEPPNKRKPVEPLMNRCEDCEKQIGLNSRRCVRCHLSWVQTLRRPT